MRSGTNSTLTPSALPSACAMSTSKPRNRLWSLVDHGEGQIVAGHADPQRAALDDIIEPRRRRLLRWAVKREHSESEQGGQRAKHRFLHRRKDILMTMSLRAI